MRETGPDGLAPRAQEHHTEPIEFVITRLEETLRANADVVVAVGESGLDFFRTGEKGAAAQREAFRAHIALAKDLDLPLQIHDRDAHAACVEVLEADGAPERTVFHCFSGDAELARICNENGWYMSFAGTVTFKNSHGVQAGLREARRELIMVETDAPFLTPHPYRGRPNAPYLAVQTARWIAEHLETPLEQLCEQVERTSREVYGEH